MKRKNRDEGSYNPSRNTRAQKRLKQQQQADKKGQIFTSTVANIAVSEVLTSIQTQADANELLNFQNNAMTAFYKFVSDEIKDINQQEIIAKEKASNEAKERRAAALARVKASKLKAAEKKANEEKNLLEEKKAKKPKQKRAKKKKEPLIIEEPIEVSNSNNNQQVLEIDSHEEEVEYTGTNVVYMTASEFKEFNKKFKEENRQKKIEGEIFDLDSEDEVNNTNVTQPSMRDKVESGRTSPNNNNMRSMVSRKDVALETTSIRGSVRSRTSHDVIELD